MILWWSWNALLPFVACEVALLVTCTLHYPYPYRSSRVRHYGEAVHGISVLHHRGTSSE